MPSRRFHGKTRTGCTSCKARHVKCGEEQPVCSNCRRRNTECIYAGDMAMPFSGVPRDPSPVNGSEEQYDGLDLALMHRYSTATSLSLISLPEAQHLWQFEVPAMAAGSNVLQHGILALASMDLACAAAKDHDFAQMAKYRSRSLHHQQTALPRFRALIGHSHGDADQRVIFVFSIMLLMLAFASAHSAKMRPNLNEILDLFALFQGPRLLWEKNANSVNKHLIAAMFPSPYKTVDEVIDSQDLPDVFYVLESSKLDDACKDAVSRLNAAWKFVQAQALVQGQDIRAVGWFPALLSDDFSVQVRGHQANALAILAQYSTVLGQFRDRWWIGTWDLILESAIREACLESLISMPSIWASTPVKSKSQN